jgi:DNA-binding CsgD family transcriptional regulator
MARILVKLQPCDALVQRKRKLVAEFCRLLGEQIGRGVTPGHDLPPRLRQTLQGILAGDGEKRIAYRLGLSRNTVHVYVKNLYRHYDVCSRGELLARFVRGRGSAGRHAVQPSSTRLKQPSFERICCAHLIR